VFVFALVLFFSFMASAFAETQLHSTVNELKGIAYKWGGTTEGGFDCSGFTRYVYAQFNVDLPHSSKSQAQEGSSVSKSNLRPGDLVFFNTDGKGISHVGIYLGDNEFVHAATNKGVSINKLNDAYYSKRYVAARRVMADELYHQVTQEN
jgi:cell wall-associated NlpC family hydrolase